MARRTDRAAERAAQEASEAARTLAARGQEVRQERTEKVEPSPEPQPERKAEKLTPSEPGRIEKLLENRTHTQAMEAILEKRGINKEEDDVPAETEKTPEPVQAAPVEEKHSSPEPEVVAPSQPEAPKTARVKVDGEEFDVPQEEIDEAGGVKAYQLQRAQENRLRKANEAVAESKKLTAQLVELLQKHQQPAAPQKTDVDFIAEKMDVVRFGTPAEAAAALLEIQQRSAKPLDANSIINQAVAMVDRRQAAAEFAKEFPEIVSNQLLVRLAVSLENDEITKAKNENKAIDWRNLYRTIGNQVRSVVPQRPSQPATAPQQTAGTPSPAPSEKEARKASITVLPTASARAEPAKVEKELTPEEERKAWIAEQRKARGQG